MPAGQHRLSLEEAAKEFRSSKILGSVLDISGAPMSVLPEVTVRLDRLLPPRHHRSFKTEDLVYALYKVEDGRFATRTESDRPWWLERRQLRIEETKQRRLARATGRPPSSPPQPTPPSGERQSTQPEQADPPPSNVLSFNRDPQQAITDPNGYIRANYQNMRTWELAKHTGYSPHTIRRKLSDWRLSRSR